MRFIHFAVSVSASGSDAETSHIGAISACQIGNELVDFQRSVQLQSGACLDSNWLKQCGIDVRNFGSGQSLLSVMQDLTAFIATECCGATPVLVAMSRADARSIERAYMETGITSPFGGRILDLPSYALGVLGTSWEMIGEGTLLAMFPIVVPGSIVSGKHARRRSYLTAKLCESLQTTRPRSFSNVEEGAVAASSVQRETASTGKSRGSYRVAGVREERLRTEPAMPRARAASVRPPSRQLTQCGMPAVPQPASQPVVSVKRVVALEVDGRSRGGRPDSRSDEGVGHTDTICGMTAVNPGK